MYEQAQVLVTSHVHETDLRQQSQGYEILLTSYHPKKVKKTSWPESTLVNSTLKKKNSPKGFNRIQILTKQESKRTGSKTTWLTKTQENMINSQGKKQSTDAN